MVWRPSDTCGSLSSGVAEQSATTPWPDQAISGTPEGTANFKTAKKLLDTMKKPVRVSLFSRVATGRQCSPQSKSRF